MKKLVIMTMLLGTATVAMADRYIEARLGLNGLGSYNYSVHEATMKENTKGVGADLIVEMSNSVNQNLYLGLGGAYQINEDNEREDNPLFKSIPIYGLIRYDLGNLGDSSWFPFIKGHLGFSFNSKDGGEYSPNNGLYYALGVGIENDGVTIGVYYQNTKSEINHIDYNYSRFTFGIGYKFQLNRFTD